MDYKNKHEEEITRATQLWECGDITRENLEYIFPELAESEDERIRKWLICGMNALKEQKNETFATIPIDDAIAWLEKQGKSKWSEEDSLMIDSIIDTIKWLEGKGATNMKIDWLKQLKQRIHDNFEKTCKNDTLLDLLNKIPSYITVDGIDYHFVMKKTSIYMAYYACYKGNGEEGRGNAIFGITAHSPIDLLTEMLEILKEKGLL